MESHVHMQSENGVIKTFNKNWDTLSLNPKITWDIVVNNLDKPWDWVNLSQNKNITWNIIVNNPENHGVGGDWVGIQT